MINGLEFCGMQRRTRMHRHCWQAKSVLKQVSVSGVVTKETCLRTAPGRVVSV